jgi:hypothetical protein
MSATVPALRLLRLGGSSRFRILRCESTALRGFILSLWVITIALMAASQVHAATYYVDFASGSDSATGLSPTNAWKHCPGDAAATGVSASKTFSPGDTVLFKGGVIYRGSISVNASGASGSPITFKGDGWGPEKARLDGADVAQLNWTVCPSQAFALGNPNYAKIYYAAAPVGFASFLTGLYEDGDFLWYSQGPDVTDPFYYDNMYEYYPIPQGSSSVRQTRTSITDTTRFTQTDASFWNGAQVATWIQGNLVAIKAVTSFDPATDMVHHEDLGANPYTDRTSYYSMLNHVSLISRPGEYAYDPAQNRLYVWPRNSDSAANHEYAVQVRDTAFNISSRSHVTLEGFNIQHFAQGVYASSTAAAGATVRNNDVSKLRSANKYAVFVNAGNSLVEGNRVVDCLRAVGILSSATGIVIRSNYVSRTSRQGIWFMGATRSQIANNVITDIQGSHANALSIYSGASDILVAHNIITLANLPITYEASSNLTFFGNIVDGRDQHRPVSEWFGGSGRIAFINNTFVRNPDSTCILVLSPGSAQYVIINNIMDAGGPASSTHDYNLFLGSPGWALAANEELRTTLADVFVSPGSGDWRPKLGGPAVDKGTNPTQYLPTSVFPSFNFNVDINGNGRAANGLWDRGAYEYATNLPDTNAPAISGVSVQGLKANLATIVFSTSEPARSGVAYGTNSGYGSNATNATLASTHTLSLSGLLPTTLYHYRVHATDASGNHAQTADLTFQTVAVDLVSPTVSLTAPGAGSVVSNTVTLSAAASDDVGVAGVVFLVDGTVVGIEDTTAPYSLAWDTTGLANGAHSVSARARDAAGNQTTSGTVSITVGNAALPGEFNIGDRVMVNIDPTLRVRSSAALSGSVLGEQPVGALGTVVAGPVSADGYTWWQINYDSAPDGWSIEGVGSSAWLTRVTIADPPKPQLNLPVVYSNGTIVLSWTGEGTLQLAPTSTGPWSDVVGAASPFTWTPSAGTPQAFARIRK